MKRFRGGLVFKADRLLYHSTLGLRVIKKRGPAVRLFATPAGGSYLRRIDPCITQLKAQGPSRTCNESKEEEEEGTPGGRLRVAGSGSGVGVWGLEIGFSKHDSGSALRFEV